tara:strand:- start:269 stop:397 length:129 start_codon:yes stop_codon:yes gene_type:complete
MKNKYILYFFVIFIIILFIVLYTIDIPVPSKMVTEEYILETQ